MENENKIKVHYNVQDVETKFYCDLREDMDVLRVKIEMPDTKKICEKDKVEPDVGTEETAIS